MNPDIDPTSHWDPALDAVAETIADGCAEAWSHTGAQLVVIADGDTVADLAAGTGHREQPLGRDTLSALYCSTKPFVATAVLAQVADGEASLDDRVGDIGAGTWIAALTIADLLTHTAGLHTLDEITARILPASMRRDVVASLATPPGWRTGIDGTYAPFASWWILGEILEALTDTPFDETVTGRVTGRYGIDADDLICRFNAERHTRLAHRLSATYDMTGQRPLPLLAEVGVDTCCEWNPAYGAYGTAGALARFYHGVLDDLDGAALALPAELAAAATTARARTWDHTLGREASFGLGFMCELTGHHFGTRISDASFGHSAQGGTSWAFADPEARIVVAATFNGGADLDTALRLRRGALIDRIYTALGAGD